MASSLLLQSTLNVSCAGMFSAARKAVLDSCIWKQKGGVVDFIEARQAKDEHCAASDQTFNNGRLRNDSIVEWIKDPSGQLKDSSAGRIRMVICERTRYDPLDFPISCSIFGVIEQAFHLHPATLPTFQSHAGTFSRYLIFADPERRELKRISIILKAPQKREIANYGLSLSYDVASRTTTALLYGAEVQVKPDVEVDQASSISRQQRQYDLKDETFSVTPELLDLIHGAAHAWNHPLLLPVLLLQHHMHRTRAFTNYGKLIDQAVQIERELGVTRVGQYFPPSGAGAPGQAHKTIMRRGGNLRARAEELTVLINTQSTRIVFTLRSPEWNLMCSKWVLKMLDSLRHHLPGQHTEHDELRALLEFNIGFAEAAVHDVTNVRERMTLQLNVLYNFVAQMDNALNAQLAAAASRDSTSMKILAFISAVFLPGSFISGVFSMGMFNWQYTEEGGENRIVSKRFWIYWVTTIPLTMLTLLGWAFWWRVEVKRFKQNFKDVLAKDTDDDS